MEGELLAGLGGVIPEPLREALPQELREVLQRATGGADSVAGASAPSTSGSGKPLASWTITSDDEGELPPYYANGAAGGDGRAEEAPQTPQQIAASQLGEHPAAAAGAALPPLPASAAQRCATAAASALSPLPSPHPHVHPAAEVAEVQAAVAALRQQLEALQANNDPSRAAMARLNLREARQALVRALEEVAPAARAPGADAALAAAVAEAELLLADVAAVEVAAP